MQTAEQLHKMFSQMNKKDKQNGLILEEKALCIMKASANIQVSLERINQLEQTSTNLTQLLINQHTAEIEQTITLLEETLVALSDWKKEN